MMKMRRIIAILCTAAMLLSVTACGGKETGSKPSDEKSSVSSEPAVSDEASSEDSSVAEESKESDESSEKEPVKNAEFDVLYEINADGDAEVVGYSGEGNQITISSSYEGCDVVRIADSAFENCTMLESIIMWADIEEIGNSAFKGCTGLTEFSVPSETTMIGHNAFEGCTNLKSLIIWGDPDIGEYAFAKCVSLKDISIGSSTKNVGAHAFEGCTGVTSIIIWGADIIGDYAFAGCTGVKDVSIPSDVLSIGNHAFDGCTALKSVIVWDDDTAIGKDAFANCPKLSDAPTARGTVLECTFANDSTEKPTESKEPSENSSEAETPAENLVDGMRPEFKEAIDSYEAFFDEYCEFMKKYNESPDDLTLLAQYAEYIAQYTDTMSKMEALDDGEMNDAETKYYIEVTSRINQKLLEIAL